MMRSARARSASFAPTTLSACWRYRTEGRGSKITAPPAPANMMAFQHQIGKELTGTISAFPSERVIDDAEPDNVVGIDELAARRRRKTS